MADVQDIAVLGVTVDPKGVVTGVKIADRELKKLTRTTQSTGNALQGMGKKVVGLAAAFIGFQQINRGLRGAMNAMLGMETGLIGVAKTANLTHEQVNRMKDAMLNLERVRPETAEDLLEIAQAAGQMGVTGIPQIMQFTRVMADLAMASDVAGEEGAKSIKRILDQAGEGVMTIDRFAASLVGLGNTAAASEQEILGTASEVARAVSVFNLRSHEVLAFATALRETDQRPQLAGSALGRVARMLNEVAQEGGPALATMEELNEVVGRDILQTFAVDAAEGLNLFFGALSGGNARSIPLILEDLGLAGEEINKVIPVLAMNYDNLNLRLGQSRELYHQNTALIDEATRAMGTMSARIGILRNNIRQWARSLLEAKEGPINDFINGLTTAFQLLNLGESRQGFGQLAATLGMAALDFIDLIQSGVIETGILIRNHLAAALIWAGKKLFNYMITEGMEVIKTIGGFLGDVAQAAGKAFWNSFSPTGDGKGIGEIMEGMFEDAGSELGRIVGNDTYFGIYEAIREGAAGGQIELFLSEQASIWIQSMRERFRDMTEGNNQTVMSNQDALIQSELEKGMRMTGLEVQGGPSKGQESYDKFRKGWQTAANQFGDSMQMIEEAGQMTFNAMEGAFSSLTDDFVDDLKLSTDEIGKFFKNLGAEIMKIVLMQALIRPLLSSIGLPMFNGPVSATPGTAGLVTGATDLATPAMTSFAGKIAHTGGIAGSQTLPAGVRRYHTGGFAGNEVPIIAKRGEGIFTPEQMAAMGPAGGTNISTPINVTVNMNGGANGGNGQNSGGATNQEQHRAMGELIGETVTLKVREEVGRMMLPGGQLYRLARPNG